MRENKHTPEPWYCENCGEGFDIFDSNDHSIIDGSFGLIECESNARRIVACVNACAGSQTDALEEMQRRGLTFGQLAFLHARLQQQRDELLSDLAEAKRSAEFNFEQYQDVGRLLHEECEKTEKLLAALGVAQATINCAGISTPKIVRDTVEKYAEAISSVKGGV